MDEAVRHLLRTVEDLLEEYRGLVEDGGRQREALVAGDMEALERIVRMMDERMKRIAGYERSRLEIAESLARAWGMRPEELRLSTVAQRVEPATRRRMEEITGEFDGVLRELERVNDQNRVLTERSLDYVRQMIDVITAVGDVGVYGPPDGVRAYGPDSAGGPGGVAARGSGPAEGPVAAPVRPGSGMPPGGSRLFDTRA